MSQSVLENLYPELEERRNRSRSARKKSSPSDTMRGVMDEVFGDISGNLDDLQSPAKPLPPPSPQPVSQGVSQPVSQGVSQGVSQPVSQCETPRDTGGDTGGDTHGDTHGDTMCETVSQCDTVCETVSQYSQPDTYETGCETGCETLAKIHPLKLRFLSFVFSKKKSKNPWRFSVKEAAKALNSKQVTVRNYPKYCADQGWMRYRVIKSASWQGIEVLWLDREIEEQLEKIMQSSCETGCETGCETVSQKNIPHACETGCETVSQDNPKSLSKIDRYNNLSISEGVREKLLGLTPDLIAFNWPELSRIGFGLNQIEQIISNLERKSSSLNFIFSGLDYANFALENKQLHGVAKPLDYIFTSLARNGCFKRPDNYVSQIEQAEKDAADEAERIAKEKRRMIEAKEEIAFISWLENVDEKTLEEKYGPKRGPREQWLKHCWRNDMNIN